MSQLAYIIRELMKAYKKIYKLNGTHKAEPNKAHNGWSEYIAY